MNSQFAKPSIFGCHFSIRPNGTMGFLASLPHLFLGVDCEGCQIVKLPRRNRKIPIWLEIFVVFISLAENVCWEAGRDLVKNGSFFTAL